MAPSGDAEAALAAVAETECGLCGDTLSGVPPLIHAAASLDIPLLLPRLDPALALKVLALAIAEDLSPREIEAALRGERAGEPDAESWDAARELLAGG